MKKRKKEREREKKHTDTEGMLRRKNKRDKKRK